MNHSKLLLCNGQIVGQPRKRECRQNVRKMSEMSKDVKKCQKMSEGGGAENTIFGEKTIDYFAYLVK